MDVDSYIIDLSVSVGHPARDHFSNVLFSPLQAYFAVALCKVGAKYVCVWVGSSRVRQLGCRGDFVGRWRHFWVPIHANKLHTGCGY